MQQLATCPCNKSLPRKSSGLVPLDAVFLDVDPTAIAAASIAQVFENHFSLLMLQ
jgi:predicted unusual protein kinase regulating ubiquinone biosynthesis (AarF/ABC1/UbiB family)